MVCYEQIGLLYCFSYAYYHTKSDELSVLHANSFKALEIVGGSTLTMFDFPDNHMDSADLLDVVKNIEGLVDKYNPNIVYTHHAGDVNIDHKMTHDAVVTACRSLPGQCVRRILFFETVSSTEWQMATVDKFFMPNWYIDIGGYMEQKLKALECYESEMREYPHSRSYEAVKILAEYRGFTVGKRYAEAFELGRNIED